MSMVHNKGSQPNLRKFKKIPIHIVEEHNEVLQFIYSAIGAKILPLKNNTIVHFDSHPDLMIDRKLKGELARSGRKVLDHLQIENWILPASAASHITEIIWIRPSWCDQIKDGKINFQIGDHPDTGCLRVNAKEPYFLSDALYCDKLLNTEEVTLIVSEFSQFDESLVKSPYILDIDLDFFSVDDPFLKMYNLVNLADRLKVIYDFKEPDNLDSDNWTKANEERDDQIIQLEMLFEHLDKYNSFDNWTGERGDRFYKVIELVDSLEKEYPNEKIDWLLIHDAGCTRDHGGLPKHISSPDEELYLIEKFKKLITNLPPPAIITISRSSEDEYCPKKVVERLQSLVVDVLKQIFNTEQQILHYLHE